MKSLKQVVTLLFLFALLSTSLTSVRAQDDETQPLDDKFVGALVAMAVNDNMMEGENEIRDLKALHSFVSDYYDDRIAADPNSTGAQWLGLQKKLLTSKLEEEINIKSGRDGLAAILSIFTEEEYLNLTRESMGLRRFVSGDDDPPPDYFSAINANTLKDPQAMIDLILEIDTLTALPSIAPSISSSASSWSHDISAISNSTAGLRVAGGAQPGISFGGVDTDASPGAGTQATKPVRFDNNGFVPVTVKVASYAPASGYSPSVPIASTVVSPESTSSAYLDLPLGTYTFCYEWQLDQDSDNDDYFDYHHRETNSVTLTASTSDNPNNAVSVTLSPDSAVSNPNGKCGQNLASDTSGLTAEEAANAGLHNYWMTCIGHEWCEEEPELVSLEISFSAGNMTIVDQDISDEVTALIRDSLNRYIFSDEDGVSTLVLTTQGFSYQIYDSGVTFFYELQDGGTASVSPSTDRQDENSAPGTPSNDTSNDSGLTPEEAAVAGTHTYSVSSPQYPNDPEAFVTYTITFSPGSAVIQDTYGTYYIFAVNEVYVEKIGENLYSYSQFGDQQTGTVTFTGEGFTTTWTSDGFSIIRTLQD